MLDEGLTRGVITVLTFMSFLGICWWAYRPANRERFEHDALLAFDDDSSHAVLGEHADSSVRDGDERQTR